ncbi:MAG: DUF2339 domain-containing protein [Vicinamibacteria bacterium]|nr:DUF2339 domain-containing protein [Vicinamibacteria bacterium]
MFLSLAIAVAFAFFALLRSGVLAARVRELQTERDELLATVAAQRQKLAGRSAPAEALGPRLTEATPAESSAGAIPVPDASEPSGTDDPSPRPLSATEARPEPSGTDWEGYLGIEGASWVGGTAFLLSAVFFVRWAVDQGLIGAGAGFTAMLLAGAAALGAAELAKRRKVARAASPFAAAGVALVGIALFAAHSRYALIPMAAAFLGLAAVAAGGGLLALRYRALAPAILSLAGGFGAALALSNDGDRPASLVGYVLLLNAFLLAVATKGRWPALLWPGLSVALLIAARWFWLFMSPENMATGVGVALVLGLFYLALPMAAGETEHRTIRRISAVGGVAPFLFAFGLATSSLYVGEWRLLFAMIAALDAAIMAVAVLFGRGALLRGAAVLTSLTLPWWALQGLKAEHGVPLLEATLGAIGIVAIFGVARRAAARFGRAEEAAFQMFEGAALVAGGGLFIFGLVMVGYDRGSPAGAFLTLATALGVLLIEISGRKGRLMGAVALCAAGLVVLTQVWFFSAVSAPTLVFYLAGPILVSLLLVLLAWRKARTAVDIEAEVAVQISGWVSILGLFAALVPSDRTSSGWPLFLALASTGWPLLLALAIQVFVLIGSVMRSEWTAALPLLLGASALHIHLWQRAYLTPDQRGATLLITLLLYLTFVLLPLKVPFGRWKDALPPWLTSAMAGPLFFFPFRTLYESAFGAASIGVLPLILAGVVALTLRAVWLRFPDGANDEARLVRTRHLTLFASVTCGLVAMSVTFQFERQWMTLGWALEALAFSFLFGRLKHPALAVFAGMFYALVAARLLLNPAVLAYAEHGWPIVNWILYTYGAAIACCWAGQAILRRASTNRWISFLARGISLLGLLLVFWLVNLEILDFFSAGATASPDESRGYAARLAFSAGWGLYAVGLLAAGVLLQRRPLRYLSLGFLVLTILKVFLYDLAALGGVFKALSLLGLAAGLLLVSFFYQRFVFRKAS